MKILCDMKNQQSICTLPGNNGFLSQDLGALTPISGFNGCFYNDSSWPTIITEGETLIPCFLYQYSVLQMTCDQFQNLANICQQSIAIAPYENCAFVTEYSPDPCNILSTPFLSGSECSDSLVPKIQSCEELGLENLTELPQEISASTPMVMAYGAVSILLRHLVRIDISPESGLYISVTPANCIAAINGTGDKSCIIHPNGRVFHDGNDIHMSSFTRRAKICKKGVIFTSTELCLSYLVDESGTKTTAERFRDLTQDFSFQVFYSESLLEDAIQECFSMVEKVDHRQYSNGDETWVIGNYKIKQDQWGDIKVTSLIDSRVFRISPSNGQITLKTKASEICVGRYPNSYLFVRKNNQVVSACTRGFSVQNGTQKAGINSTGKVVLH